jgi:iron complex outermembrane receptor protein
LHTLAINERTTDSSGAGTWEGRMKIRTKFALLCTFSGLALAPVPVLAQEEATQDDKASAGNEIVVTAQKREERLRDVPVTVTVVSGEQLQKQNINDLTELQNASPELVYTAGPSGGYSIRGSGAGVFNSSAENNVSMVVDGVVQGQLAAPRGSLFDIQRVEVLSGPQGMLFGKNASAGVVNIVTNAPNPRGVGGAFRVEMGENGHQLYRGMLNLPVSAESALRVTGFRSRHDGLLFNRARNEREAENSAFGGRGRFLWRPSDSVEINIIGDYEKADGDDFLWTLRTATGALAALSTACGVTPGPENTDLCIDGPNYSISKNYGVSGQIDWTLGGYTLTSITAGRWVRSRANSDSDSTRLNILNRNSSDQWTDQFSQELRLASPAGERLSYVLGLYYYDYAFRLEADQAGTLGLLPVNADRASASAVRQFSYAAFGQASFKVTDQINLIAGGRVTHDKLEASVTNFTIPSSGIAVPGFTPPAGTAQSDIEKTDFSYRVGAQYLFGNGMVYATYTRGYKGAALNVGTQGPLSNSVVQPEYPLNLEVGAKASLLDGGLTFEFSAYRQVVKDFQAQLALSTGGIVQFVFANASELRIHGAQLNFAARPFAGLNLGGGISYNDATYGDFTVPCNLPYTQGCTTVGTTPVINVEGRQLARSPKWKLVLSGEYSQPFSARFEGFVGGTANYRSKVFMIAQPDPNLELDGFATFDARAGVRGPDGNWSLSVYAKNLTDERAAAYTAREPISPVGNYVTVFTPSSFRQIGLALDVRF